MNKTNRVKTHENLWIFILILVSSVFYIWLIPNPLKYFFLLYVIGAYIVLKKIYLYIADSQDSPKQNTAKPLDYYRMFDISFLIFPILLIINFSLHLENLKIISTFLSVFLTAFSPGYCLFVGNKKIRSYFSNMEFVLFIFFVSYTITAVLWLLIINLFSNFEIFPLILYICYLLIGIINFRSFSSKKREISHIEIPSSFSGKKDKYGILLIIIIFTFSHILIYPDIIFSDVDINRHYAYGLQLARDYGLYLNRNWGNIISHLFESAFIYSSQSNVEIVTTFSVSFNYFSPIAFYCMIKRVFTQLDHRLPILSTWIYTTGALGGIGWIYHLKTKILNQWFGQTLLYDSIVNTVFYQTFKSNSYGFLPSYFRPINISLMMFFFLITLMHSRKIQRKYYISIFATLLFAMYLIHVVEALIFSIFLVIWAFGTKSPFQRIYDTLVANSIGIFVSFCGFFVLNLLKNKVPLFYLVSLMGLFSLSLLLLLYRKKVVPQIVPKYPYNFLFIKKKWGEFIKKIITKLFLVFFFCGLIMWVIFWDTYEVSTKVLNRYRDIPWFFQSLRLGVNGLVGMLYFNKLHKSKRYSSSFDFFLSLSVFSFIFGRAITFVNKNFFPSSPIYWETRFEVFIIIPWIIFAVLYSIETFDKFNSKLKKFNQYLEKKTNNLLGSNRLKWKRMKIQGKMYGLMSIIFFSLFTTTLLNLEVRWGVAAPLKIMTSQPEWDEELEGISFMSDILDIDPSIAVITISKRTYHIINLAGPAKLSEFKSSLYESDNPAEVLIKIEENHFWRDSWTYNDVYFYLTLADMTELQACEDSFLLLYIKTIPIVFKNTQIFIFNASRSSFPVPQSNTALISPINPIFDSDIDWKLASAILSQADIEYSMVKENGSLDPYKNIILGYDVPNRMVNTTLDFNNFELQNNWSVEDATKISIPCNSTYNISSNLIYPIPLKYINIESKITFNGSLTNNSNYVDIMFDQNLDSHFSYVRFNLTEEKRVLWDYYDEFEEKVVQSGVLNTIKVTVNSSYLLNLEFNDNKINISLNNNSFFSLNSDCNSIQIGLNLFLNNSQGSFILELIKGDITEFYPDLISSLDYYESLIFLGRNLFIFNTNGYHNFANSLFSTTENNTDIFNTISGINSESSLPQNISGNIITNLTLASPIVNFTNGITQTPFIMQKKIGLGYLYYINIFPFARSLNITEQTYIENHFMKEIFIELGLNTILHEEAYQNYLESGI